MNQHEFRVAYCYTAALRLWDEGFIDGADYNWNRDTFDWEMWSGYHSLNAAEIQEEYSWIRKNESAFTSKEVIAKRESALEKFRNRTR